MSDRQPRRKRGMTVGMVQYRDCHKRCYPDDAWLVCSTWAHHVSLTLSTAKHEILNVDLDRVSVHELVEQLQEWLDSG